MTTTPLTTDAIREMRAAITQGEWHYQERSDAYTHIVRAGDRFMCQLAQDPTGQAEANTRFIAAAPEIVDFLLAEVERLRITAMKEAAKLVCMYCSGNALGYEPASGPNSAGNYTHESKNKRHLVTETRFAGDREGRVLCIASSIHAQLRYEAATKEGT